MYFIIYIFIKSIFIFIYLYNLDFRIIEFKNKIYKIKNILKKYIYIYENLFFFSWNK